MGKSTFGKAERLKKEKVIQELFSGGSSFYLFPFKVFYLAHPDPSYPFNQVLVSVSKKNFKRAVDRNRIKRLVREAYRLQKQTLPEAPRLVIGYVYTHKEILLFDEVKKRMFRTLERLSREVTEASKPA